MAKNIGKIFEEQFKISVPDYALLIRLPDPPQSFVQSNDTRFSHKNPCDYICYDTNVKTLYCLELKTTSGKSIGFEDIYSDKPQNKMVHRHQILGLLKFSEYKNVVSGFLFNFRHFEDDKDKYFETTYFQSIKDFRDMTDKIGKKSFDEINLVQNNAIKIYGCKKRTRYIWDIDSFFKSQYDESIER